MSLPESSAANTPGFNTRAVHAGQAFEPRTGAVVPPVHFSSTYAQEAIGGAARRLRIRPRHQPHP